MNKPAARLSDLQVCTLNTAGVAHVGGSIAIAAPRTVFVNGMKAATIQDQCPCAAGGPNVIAAGSGSVFFDGLAAARQTDSTAHGGRISSGSADVFIGD
ncbi:Zn-binding Pro-Ala-Ala-Arg (PAAR) domain-containing protein, incolved in TypeVI secretion [Dyadobacter sp. SG02]|uniref:PAAR domain-containing protein n=1 Tax=Dyadobacter sp. SG02 TaxID=1855291 RepID=UPI0008ADFA3A|nr:PAAR domain-containing protein [Dyadobacter sp. SG02]SEI51309.1 Zn-binding Pro-Ala-Ala-Arg (PAAR) domain-containing protein, incolved in TypeVI secretion [Dyadobacter sp. SG02]